MLGIYTYQQLRWPFQFNETIVIQKWDNFSAFYDVLPTVSRLRVRRYMKTHHMPLLEQWSYAFSGWYTPASLSEAIVTWPQKSYIKVTLLEWWSLYDSDAYLTSQWLIQTGDYSTYVMDHGIIDSLRQQYSFVDQFFSSKKVSSPFTLEWFLYPDTYHLSNDRPIVEQLVQMQLNVFRDKVMLPLSSQIESFSEQLKSQGYTFSMGLYNIITLASIIEKEERSDANKPIIAWIFLNRIENNMRIDADITLCYGLHMGYDICTPSLIARSLNDRSNVYNTRVHSGLTPTPIASPSFITIQSLLRFQKNNNIFYLHDDQGQIYSAEDIQWHNNNKSKYL